MAWLFVFAEVWRVNYLPGSAYLTLALAVWALHVVDRLSTALSRSAGHGPPPAAHHQFIVRHGSLFIRLAAVVCIVPVVLAMVSLPISIFGYLIVAVLLVVGFFLMSRASEPRTRDLDYGKNILGGAAFAYGIAMMAHVFLPAIGKHDLLVSREFLTFAVLCVVYLCAIDFWEKSANFRHESAGGTAIAEEEAPGELALMLPLMVLALAALVFAVSSHHQSVRPFYYAILTGAALLYVLNRSRHRFPAVQLRLLADGAMLAPALVFHGFPPG